MCERERKQYDPSGLRAPGRVGIVTVRLTAAGTAPPSRVFRAPIRDAGRVIVARATCGCCPVFPGKRYLDWELPDPAGQGVDAVRPIRDEIEKRMRGLLDEIAPAGQA